MNSTIHLTTKKKDTSSVPIVILKRKYSVMGEEETVFNWMGILYPLEKIRCSVTNFMSNWANSLQTRISPEEISLSREVIILNTDTCIFEKVDKMPENISILIQENININER